jgi:glycogen debranching enzyme
MFFLLSPTILLAAEPADFLIPQMHAENTTLVQMFNESVEVAIQSIQTALDGSRFLSAGPRYSIPPRTYYRDSYWTSGLVLFIDPSAVREQIIQLARGIEQNGAVPSAIVVDGTRLKIPLWIDHHDSGPYFIMLVYDYLRYTGDQTILDEGVNGRRIYTMMEDILTYLGSLDSDGDLLPEKPSNSLQDWLDTVPRGGEVLYDEVLYFRALRTMAEIAALRGDEAHATVFNRHSLLVRHQINSQFWYEAKGYYFERCEKNACVDRLTNESSLAALYDVVQPKNRERFFLSLKQLETPWGVVNVVPAYSSSLAHRYQNQTDWPVLDGMNAGARLKYGNKSWEHPMTKWWISFDAVRSDGEKLPEFFSPTDLSGGRSQAWSVNPIVSFIRYGIGVDPALDGTYTIRPSPSGDITLKNIWVRGQKISVHTQPK